MTHARIISLAALSGLVVGAVAMLAALIFLPLKYSAEARVLAVPRMVPGVDPYTSSKAAERIAQSLAQVIQSSQFFNRVISMSLGIDVSYFPTDELKRRELWRKTADATVGYNSGIITVVVYHPDRDQAVRIATSIVKVMTSAGNEFAVGAADYKLMDTPVVSRFPKQPNFPAIGIAGFLGGALVTVGYLARHRRKSA